MKILFTKDDGTILDHFEVRETPRPCNEDLNDDNIYLDETESVELMCIDAVKFCQREIFKHA